MCCCIPKEYEKAREIDKGVQEFEAKSWKGFCQIISEEFILKKKANCSKGKYYINDFVWRGHRCANWDLISFFDREFQKHYKENEGIKERLREYILERHLNSFVYASRNKLDQFGLSVAQIRDWLKNGIISKNHVWALGQHYGVATPMLDWCCSPFVAAFFAFREKNENHRHRAVWGLNLQITDLHKRLVPQITYFDPMSSEYPRLINQRGLFTISDNGGDIITLVQKRWKENEKEEPWLIKIEIEDEKREDFLRGLDSMNINHMSIYPEIYGAAKFSNLGLEFNDYARFHGQGPKVEDDPKEICNNHQ